MDQHEWMKQVVSVCEPDMVVVGTEVRREMPEWLVEFRRIVEASEVTDL